MCKFYCTSEGSSCNLECLHCGTRYCAVCLHGQAGKMEKLTKCAKCGKKPRVLSAEQRGGWNDKVVDVHRPHFLHDSQDKQEAKTGGAGGGVGGGPVAALFEQYCNRAPRSDALDNAKFAKCAADHQWLDAKLTRTDVDMIFTKTKAKGARRIGLESFEAALQALALQKYGASAHNRLELLLSAVPQKKSATHKAKGSKGNAGAKQASGCVVAGCTRTRATKKGYCTECQNTTSTTSSSSSSSSKQSVVDRLTNTANYTGAHKHRFDESGRGIGSDYAPRAPGSVASRRVISGRAVDLADLVAKK
mmetsp:Transcript_4986/g.9640  ORF Transcript_4986/g.9640 Transcript_4986/m.9640 type:complete len:305 (-) Transcript_4986:70-984(-)